MDAVTDRRRNPRSHPSIHRPPLWWWLVLLVGAPLAAGKLMFWLITWTTEHL